MQGSSSYVAHNVFEDNFQNAPTSTPIFVDIRATPVIEKNTFRNNRSRFPTTIDGAAILIQGEASPLIRNNIFHDNEGAAVSERIPRPNASPVIINNTMVRNTAGFRRRFVPPTFPPTGLVVRNNIMVDGQFGLEVQGPSDPAPQFTFDYNLLSGNEANYFRVGDQTGTNGNISVDPRFINSAGNNFRLGASSPAIDAGTELLP